MNIQKELSTLSDTIEENKRELAQNEGRGSELLKSVKETLGVSSIEEAEEEIRRLQIKERKLEKEIKNSLSILKEKYNW